MAPVKAGLWEQTVRAIHEAITTVVPGDEDHPSSASETVETREWLANYLRVAARAETPEEAYDGQGYCVLDDAPHIILAAFRQWLTKGQGEDVTSKALAARVKDVGWEQHTIRIGETTRSMWRQVKHEQLTV